MHSYLLHQRQTVKIGDVLSEWLQQTAGMAQGSYLGPLIFAILIASLQPSCQICECRPIDDTTMTEIINKGSTRCMQTFVDELISQSTQTGMIVNDKKTKKMLIDSVIKNPPVGYHCYQTTLKWTGYFDTINDKVHGRRCSMPSDF